MRRFFLPPCEARGDLLTLSAGESHHAAGVLRVQPGDAVTVLDGAGGELFCRVRSVVRRAVTLDVIERRRRAEPWCRITLFQAIPKGAVMETIAEKAAELGAWRVMPVFTARCEVHLDAASATRKVEKWRHTAIEAVKQCGSPWLPEITAPLMFRDALASEPKCELSAFASLHAGAQPPRSVMEKFIASHQRMPRTLAIWIGPEGDFTPEELAALQSAGALPVTLGPRVLRCDTAAVSCLAVFNAELERPGV